ncbi:hypothetical protein HYPSUDRAFT_318543 [Hypholoma sublateritium FD-334 SS-4]|uniref:Uncharacterized protein n=1 Tax=Hypholoma sublateritium (strain FD-334 SS-4) TaxID=945553 RepID=A0A0D2MQU4_HYPSF|nr:hypothetical protein HYPSUDRAFT_318543 [Hypholoma sublateritium FD-334 SS-4]
MYKKGFKASSLLSSMPFSGNTGHAAIIRAIFRLRPASFCSRKQKTVRVIQTVLHRYKILNIFPLCSQHIIVLPLLNPHHHRP